MKVKITVAKLIRSGLLILALLTFSVACKKDKSSNDKVETPKDNAPTTGSRDELTKDSIHLYARQVYLWWKEIPNYDTFKPRNYSSLSQELYALTRYGINPDTKQPYEFKANSEGGDSGEPKYSYIRDITDQNPIAAIPNKKLAVDLEGNGFDFGLRVGLYGKKTNYQIYLEAVYKGSQAAAKNLNRGDVITAINDRSIGTNYDSEINFIDNALFNSNIVKLQITKATGGSVTITLNKTSYKSNPVYKDSVYFVNGKTIGYMAYARFSNLLNSQAEFDRVFARFAENNVTDLILDFRYNGGGYVSTAEYLLNLIAPPSLNGKVMYAEHYNELMQQGKATILSKQLVLNSFDKPQDNNNDGKLDTYADVDYDVASNTEHFSKKGPLNSISKVVFIVSGSTASASELVINSLKPYLDVKVVGTRTYGKPVGFYPIRIDKYDVLLSMFESRNSRNEGGYFSGIAPSTGSTDTDDDNPVYDFGDTREKSFAAAYNYITKGTYTSSDKTSAVTSAKSVQTLNEQGPRTKFGDNEFKGMIEDRIKVRN